MSGGDNNRGETTLSNYSAQRAIDETNRQLDPAVKIVVVKRSCFKRELKVVVEKETLIVFDCESKYETAITIAKIISKAFKKGKEIGMSAGKKHELELGKAYHMAYYDV